MAVIVYQTFDVRQDKFNECMESLDKIKKHRNENYGHKVEILTPITGQDHTYAILATYEGLGEMELQNKKMFDDEDYVEMIREFFLEHIVQGSMVTQFYRTMKEMKKGEE
ncbi:MAG TPA: hypothetical protein VIG80_00625 [Bacillaceae bacterium]